LERKTILLVEDEALIALSQQKMLERHGYDVVVVHSGEAAIERFDTGAGIDLILMDINLGKGIDGTQAASAILEEVDVPLIFLSSHTAREVVEKTEAITNYGYVVKSSDETVLIASIKMAFKLFDAHKSAEEQRRLQEVSEATARALLDAQFDTIVILDASGMILDCNATLAQRASVSREQIIGMCAWDMLPPEDARRRRGYLNSVIQSARMGRFEDRRADRWFDNVVYPILDARESVSRVAIVAKDITERKEAEERLRESRNLFKAIAENAADSIFIKGRDRKYAFVNEAMTRLFALKAEEIVGMNSEDLFGANEARAFVGVDERTFAGETIEFVESLTIRGKRVDLHTVQTPLVRENDRVTSIMGIIRDVTRLKRAETALETALQEKKALLLEFQHRAMNSFGMIAGMISLALRSSDSVEVARVLSDLKSRVDAISEMYALLHASSSVSSVDLGGYLESLIASFKSMAKGIEVRSRLEPIEVLARKAIPLGLITVELVTNAAKHAFPPGGEGTVEISLQRTDVGGRLEVLDTGVGLPVGFDPSSATSMGMVLIDALVRQFEGAVRFDGENGTRTVVEFAIED
jgi:PAS domain S-box-containing protein